jgi:hypothetical protein
MTNHLENLRYDRRAFIVVGAILVQASLGCGGRGVSLAMDEVDDAGAASDDHVDPGPLPDAGAFGDGSCPLNTSTVYRARAARSSGYIGTDVSYFALYNVPCQTNGDCVSACSAAGGTAGSCSTGSECITAEEKAQCLPPTYWLYTDEAVSDSNMATIAAELTLVSIDYHDALVFSGFAINLPASAIIEGLQFDVRRNADDGFAIDDVIHVVDHGQAVGTDHSQDAPWPRTLGYASYGGPNDTWGMTWRAADLRSGDFGISVTPRYTGPEAGNDRAHIDSARLTVFYTVPCN